MREIGSGEGSLEAPTRHAYEWQSPNFYDQAAIDAELRRQFEICHGCRRCFNLCDSFPRLFDLIDESPTEDLDAVPNEALKAVVDACTLCDMCFMTKCPYVPPHVFNLDVPHLMVRYRAAEFKRGERAFVDRELAKTDRNGLLAAPLAGLVNWATDLDNGLTRPLMEKVAGIDRAAAVPTYEGQSFIKADRVTPPALNMAAPASGRKAVLYATCFVNYNAHDIGFAARDVLARNGVETKVMHPVCCGMPKLENGDLDGVAAAARKVMDALVPLIDDGYDIIALTPSCALMLKVEWPLILPDDPRARKLANATFDIAEYVVDIAKKEGMAEGLGTIDGGISMHLACHSRAQNMGPKGAEMLRLIPGADVTVVERCSGHGGKWGMMKEHFETAMAVGKPAARAAAKPAPTHVVSECPLAGDHLIQGMQRLDPEKAPKTAQHPIQIIAKAYGL